MMNVVALVGRITKDPELRYSAGGVGVCNFTLAVNRNFKNQAGEYEADFVNCVAFGATAQRMEQYIRKGSQIAVNGRVQTRNYENQAGQRVYVTEIVAQSVSFLDSRSQSQPDTSTNEPSPYNMQPQPEGFDSSQINSFDDISDDDLPF